MAYETEKKIVAELTATKVSYTHVIESGVTTLIRRFPDIRDAHIEDVLVYLNTLATVEDPLADHNTYAGTWTVVANRDGRIYQDEETQGVIQILTMGTHESDYITRSADCRYTVERKFYFAVDAIPALPSNTDYVTYSAGPASFDEATGKYNTYIDKRTAIPRHVQGVEVRESYKERSVESQYLGGLPTYIATLPVAPVGSIYTRQTNIRDDCTRDVTTAYRTTRPVVAEWLGGGPLEFVYEGLYENRTSPYNQVAGQRGVYRLQGSVNEFGLYDTSMVYQVSRPAETQHVSRSTPFSRTASHAYQNVDAPVDANVDPAVTSGMYQSQFRINPDKTYSGDVTYQYGLNQGEALFESLNAGLQEDETTLYRSWGSPVAAPNPVAGVIYRASNSLGNDGLYDGQIVSERSTTAQAQHTSRATLFSKTTSRTYQNVASPHDAPTPTGSGLYQAQFRINPDKTYTGDVTYQYGLNQGEAVFESMNGGLQENETTLYKSWATPVAAPNPATGVIYRAENSLGDDGLYDGRVVSERSTTYQTEHVSSNTPFSRTAFHAYENVSAPVNAPTADSGLYQSRFRINPDKTFTGEVVYQYGLNQGAAVFESLNSGLQESDTTLYRSRGTPVEASTSGVGFSYRAENSLGADGLYDGRVVYERSVPKSGSFQSANTPFLTERTDFYRNAHSVYATPDAVTGVLYRSTVRLNPDLTTDQEIILTQADDDSAALFLSDRQALRETEEVLYRARTSPQAAPAFSPQTCVYEAQNTLRADGLYDSRWRKEKSQVGVIQWQGRSPAIGPTTQNAFYRTYTLIPSFSPATGVYSTEARLQPDATYDVRVTYELPGTEADGDFEFVSQEGALRRTVQRIYNNRSGLLEVPYAANKLYQVANELDATGLYRARVVYQAPKPEAVYKTWLTKGFIAFDLMYRNQTSDLNPAAILSSMSHSGDINNFSRRTNDDGTFDMTITSRPSIETIGGGSYWKNFDNEYDYTDVKYRTSGGVDQYRKTAMKVYVKQTTTESSAFSFIPSGDPAVYQSNVAIHNGGDNFRAIYHAFNPTGSTGWTDE